MLPQSPPQTNPTVQQRILDAASRLFYLEGTRSVGIDRIIAESGAAKASFYRHYPSKDALVVAYLLERHARWMAWFVARLEAYCAAQGPKLERAADVLREWFADPDFRGCAFINIMAEGATSPDAKQAAIQHKTELLGVLRDLAGRSGAKHPDNAAEEALLVIEGAIVRAQMAAQSDPVRHADVAVRLLATIH